MSQLTKLPRSFYLRPTLTVATDLLGRYFVRRTPAGRLIGKIVEVEAYLGARDPASHAFRGPTERNKVMFLKGGHLYVYFTYGMHYCANVVTEAEGTGHAVLLRALEPVEGRRNMMRRRAISSLGHSAGIANGPARLCQAFGISRRENGIDLLGNEIYISEGDPASRNQISVSTRIGIRTGTEFPWRFYITGNPNVSRR